MRNPIKNLYFTVKKSVKEHFMVTFGVTNWMVMERKKNLWQGMVKT